MGKYSTVNEENFFFYFNFFFGLFIFYDSLFLSEYLVMGTRLSSLGVAIKYLWCSLG